MADSTQSPSTTKYPDIITGWGLRRILTEWICDKRNIDEAHDDFPEVAAIVDECLEEIEDRLGAKFDWPTANGRQGRPR